MKFVKSLIFLIALGGMMQLSTASESKSNQSGIASSSKAIVAEIKKNGARVVVKRLMASDEQWNYINEKVASGDKNWLLAAKLLLDGTDAGSTEMLTSSIGNALDVSPATVLTTLGSIQLSSICSGPDVDSEKFGTKKAALNGLDRRIKSVQSVKELNDDLKRDKEQCIKYLEGSRAGITHFFTEEK